VLYYIDRGDYMYYYYAVFIVNSCFSNLVYYKRTEKFLT